ncbi:Xaa-Pro peptidase family protein [soil metagenome]
MSELASESMWMAHPLPRMDVAGRVDRLRSHLGESGCDALLVTCLANIRYLTGFTGSAALLLVRADDELVFVTDGRYRDQSAEELGAAGIDARCEVHATAAAQRAALAASLGGVGRLGPEAAQVTWSAARNYEGELDAELVPTDGVVEALRAVKDEGEVARIEAAGAIADAALAETRALLAERPTERALQLALAGAPYHPITAHLNFETIVASGPNGAKPHARPSGRRIEDGDLVVLDFGALVDGYHSDMTRTVLVGEGSSTQERMLEVVGASQAAGVAAVAPGVACAEVDRTCREAIAASGWADAFLHGTGHGVGLDIHEEPRVSSSATGTLAVGHVVTVEPGVYLPEHGGVRIEDTVVVTPDGCRPLTAAPKSVAHSPTPS